MAASEGDFLMTDSLYDRVCRNLNATPAERWLWYQKDAEDLCKVVPGWTRASNYGLFQSTIEELPEGSNVLVCGVYHGADLRLMIDIAERLDKRINLYGVDLFSDTPQDCWNNDQLAKGSTWEDAIGSPAPSMKNALINCASASILRADSVEFMSTCNVVKFEWIYLDTDHTYEQVAKEFKAAKNCIKKDGLISGDDFLPGRMENYEVDKAVREFLPEYTVIGGRAWFAPADQLFGGDK